MLISSLSRVFPRLSFHPLLPARHHGEDVRQGRPGEGVPGPAAGMGEGRERKEGAGGSLSPPAVRAHPLRPSLSLSPLFPSSPSSPSSIAQKVNASVTFKTITIPKVRRKRETQKLNGERKERGRGALPLSTPLCSPVFFIYPALSSFSRISSQVIPDFHQIERDLIEKVDIMKPDVELPKELPEPHHEKKLVRESVGGGVEGEGEGEGETDWGCLLISPFFFAVVLLSLHTTPVPSPAPPLHNPRTRSSPPSRSSPRRSWRTPAPASSTTSTRRSPRCTRGSRMTRTPSTRPRARRWRTSSPSRSRTPRRSSSTPSTPTR